MRVKPGPTGYPQDKSLTLPARLFLYPAKGIFCSQRLQTIVLQNPLAALSGVLPPSRGWHDLARQPSASFAIPVTAAASGALSRSPDERRAVAAEPACCEAAPPSAAA